MNSINFQNDAPIIQKVYNFYLKLQPIIEQMPKKDKYITGQKIEQITLDLLEYLISATYTTKEKKSLYLNQAAIKLDLLKLLIRLAKDIKAISLKQYLLLEEILQEIGKMIGGWIRSLK